MNTVPTLQVHNQVHMRWLIASDSPQVLEIERLSFDHLQPHEQCREIVRRRDCIGMVAELLGLIEPKILGFMVYECAVPGFHLLNLAVHPEMRRRAIGRQMIARLAAKMDNRQSGARKRDRISILVRETNLPAQIFFRAVGFRADKVTRNHYEDSGEDAYRMILRKEPTV